MTGEMRALALSVATLAFIGSSVVAAQTLRPATDAQTLSRGWSALAAGRPAEAVSLADGILKRKPRSHAAFILKIEALSAGAQPIAALDAYEAWIPKAGGNVDDRGLLAPIAAGMLRVLSTDRDAAVRASALRFLAGRWRRVRNRGLEEAERRRQPASDARAVCRRRCERDRVAPGNGRFTNRPRHERPHQVAHRTWQPEPELIQTFRLPIASR